MKRRSLLHQCFGCPCIKQVTNHGPVSVTPPINNKLITNPIMLIGESPDKKEDNTGINFCGSSGQLLRLAVQKYWGLDLSCFYLSNIVKCRQKNNNNPSYTSI